MKAHGSDFLELDATLLKSVFLPAQSVESEQKTVAIAVAALIVKLLARHAGSVEMEVRQS